MGYEHSLLGMIVYDAAKPRQRDWYIVPTAVTPVRSSDTASGVTLIPFYYVFRFYLYEGVKEL